MTLAESNEELEIGSEAPSFKLIGTDEKMHSVDSFLDYDCLLFWVAGGMTIQTPLYTGPPASTGYLSSNGFSDTTSGAWYADAPDDYCQNFIKYDLISRIPTSCIK